MAYTGRSWGKLMELKTRDNFPMAKISGRWESTSEEIDAWRREKFIAPPIMKMNGEKPGTAAGE